MYAKWVTISHTSSARAGHVDVLKVRVSLHRWKRRGEESDEDIDSDGAVSSEVGACTCAG
eukprot:29183-Eustigmatos_ZCMA.PRE.1